MCMQITKDGGKLQRNVFAELFCQCEQLNSENFKHASNYVWMNECKIVYKTTEQNGIFLLFKTKDTPFYFM